jgi:hypothetical protein
MLADGINSVCPSERELQQLFSRGRFSIRMVPARRSTGIGFHPWSFPVRDMQRLVLAPLEQTFDLTPPKRDGWRAILWDPSMRRQFSRRAAPTTTRTMAPIRTLRIGGEIIPSPVSIQATT